MNYLFINYVFWFFSGVIVYTYFLYPILLYLTSKLLSPIKSYNTMRQLPLVSIFIAVYNEENIIQEKIENSLELDYPSELLEVIVASDGSTDRTNEIIKKYKEKGVKVFVNSTNEGKNAILNKYVPFAKGEIIVFTDANSMFLPDAIEKLVMCFSNTKVGCVGGKLKYLSGQSAVSKGEGLYFRYENFIRKHEGLHGKMVGANGAIYAVRKNMFTPIPSHVPNDFFHPLSVLKSGMYSVFAEEAVAWEKPSEDEKEEFNRRTRIVTRSFGAVIEVNKTHGIFKGNIWFYLLSHKLLRWFGFPMLILILALNIYIAGAPFYKFILILQFMFYLGGVIGWVAEKFDKNIRLFYVPYYFFLINIAGIIGLYNYFFGKKVVKWKVASTTR